MRISGIQAYQEMFFASRKQAAVEYVTANRNLGPDTIRISAEAQARLDSLTGAAEPELNSMGTLLSEQFASWMENTAQTGTFTQQSKILELNYARLQAIEAEIALGNDAQELKDQKLLLTLFGDVRELTDKDLAEGVALLDELMPSRNETLAFGAIVDVLRRAYGLGGSGVESAAGEEGGESGEETLTSETRLLLEELQSFLEKTGGASVEVSLKGRIKETSVTRGANADGAPSLRFSVESSIPLAGQ